jgi:hypothetical protein
MDDPGRAIALIALEDPPHHSTAMLERVIKFAFTELCFRRSTNDLDRLLSDLREILDEEPPVDVRRANP